MKIYSNALMDKHVNNTDRRTMALDKDQKDFITNKVIELDSLEKVKTFYQKDDPVSAFANKLATKLFNKR